MRPIRSAAMVSLILVALQASAQMPTTPTQDDPAPIQDKVRPDTSETLIAVTPERYTRKNVAPDMLSASIDALNEQSHAAAYRAALSEIRENLVKVRMAALIMAYKEKIIADAKAELGLEEAQLHDTDAQFRIHLHALKRHGVEIELPDLPPGLHESGLPITPGSLLLHQQGLKP